MYNDILLYVQNLSERICRFLDIPLPNIYVRITQNEDFDGGMTPKRNRTEMFIDLCIPQNTSLKKHRAILTAITIHEHCHYYESVQMTAEARQKSLDEYLKDNQKRKADEQRTWRCTKKVAQHLNLWSKAVYNEVKQCAYTSHITFS